MFNRTLTVIIVTLGLAACQGGGSSQGGVVIPQSDGTPPEASLQVAVAASGRDSAAVSTSAGNSQSMTLRTKTTSGNLKGAPLFSSKSPQKKPGETTAESSLLFQSLDLSQEIPQSSPAPGNTIAVDLTFWVEAVNHLGNKAETPHIAATYRESA